MSPGDARHAPLWDRGEEIDEEMMRFTVGDDWLLDRRLVEVDLAGSLAHAAGLLAAGLLSPAEHEAVRSGLSALLEEHRAGAWDVEPTDEDVHSAVERRLVERIGDAGKKLHTGRSRNDQVALDVRLWLRSASEEVEDAVRALLGAVRERIAADGDLPLPGYTHLRRAMPSSVGDWLGALEAALSDDLEDLGHARRRIRRSPLGTGAGYGVPLPLDRVGTARALGFEGPEEPVTLAQWSRGRAELAHVSALEALALDLGKLACDLWLYSTAEFSFVRLPAALLNGSSMMPQKRNPDVIELLRARARQVVADRTALVDVLRDLPSGYHRDFQLLKPPLFRAHDATLALLGMARAVVRGLSFDREALAAAAADPDLAATAKALELAARGVPFRDAYRRVARDPGA